MAHLHLAWELGSHPGSEAGAPGHAMRLKALAATLLARGHHVSLSLRDLGCTHAVLADLRVPRWQAPVWLHRAGGMPPNQASLAEILLPQGYLDVAGLAGLVHGWRAMLTAVRVDLVLADAAPTALLAARSLGIPALAIGTGLACPPPDVPLPCLRDWEDVAPQRLARAEAHLLNVANAVLEQHGALPAPCAAALLRGDAALLATWPELDHYGRAGPPASWLGPLYQPVAGGAPLEWPAGTGPRVLASLKHEHPAAGAVLRALVEQGCRVLCWLPDGPAGREPPLHDPAIAYTAHPVALDEALQGAALCVCHGGATMAQALLAGVPVLALPTGLEQFLLARRIEGWGGGVNGARVHGDWAPVLQALLGDGRWRAAAQAFARRHAGSTPELRAGRIADLVEQQLA